MAEPQDTSRVVEAPDLGPGYRLDAKGRQEAEDDRLGLLEAHLRSAFSPKASDGPAWLAVP